jgi:5-methyltetrahydrofolate--homocysteine methyltransferase
MRDFRQRLSQGAIVGDGAWGSLLGGAPPEKVTLDDPGAIADIARRYVDAGAEMITTNTFGASPMRLAQHRLFSHFEEINRRGVEIVRDAIGDGAFVNASIGPCARLLAPLGDADPTAVERGFAEQARILIDAGADVICIETMTDLQEALLAIRAVRTASATVPIIATMTFEITRRGPYTVMGTSVAEAATKLAAAGADIVGANCGTGVDEMLAVADAFLECATVPVAVQPNAGLPPHPDTPERFGRALAPLRDRGIAIVGGCCGTTPAHIAALREQWR